MDEGITRIFNKKDFEGLNSHVIGEKIFKYSTVRSTNDLAFIHALKGEKEGAVFWAQGQTNGRGRLGRSWVSHKNKGLYFSIILKPEITVKDAPRITLMTGVSLSKALRKFSDKEFLIKWPNDIVIGDRKIGGILTEIDSEIQKIKFVILGIGINTNMSPGELPTKEATSLKIETGKEINQENLLSVCLKELDNSYLEFEKNGFKSILEDARGLCSLWGRQVKIEDLTKTDLNPKAAKWHLEGTAVDFDDDGALIIRQNNGFLKHIFAGDVKLLR